MTHFLHRKNSENYPTLNGGLLSPHGAPPPPEVECGEKPLHFLLESFNVLSIEIFRIFTDYPQIRN